MTLSALAVRRPVLAFVASALIVAFGVLSFQTLPLRELPDVDEPIVSVDTTYRGANAEVVENRVTRVVEDQLSGVEGIDTIESSSRDGRSSVRITFKLSRDIEAAANDVRDAVSRAARRLPDQIDPPRVRKQDADASPIMWFSLSSDERTVAELSDYARRNLLDRLSVLDGVSFVRVGGGQDYAMRVELDPRALAARGMTVDDVEAALRRQNVELPAGELETGDIDLTVRVERTFASAEAFKRISIREGGDGHVVRLGEVADVAVGPSERRTMFRGNGVTRVGLGIVRQSKSNALEVARLAVAEVEQINKTLPDDLSIALTFDGTVFVREAVSEVWRSLAFAVLLVVVVMYLFLGSLRAALVPALVVPVALIGVFVVLAAFGLSVNILTLLAMVLAIGLVVDDSIVVLENIQRRIDDGEPPLVAAERGASQVFFAVVATTAVVVAVFAPLLFVGGYIGRIFAELAVTVSGAVIISSFVALTLSPMMCSKLLVPAGKAGLIARGVNVIVGGARRAYVDALKVLLRAPVITLLVVILSGAAVWGLLNHIERELVPREDRGSIFARFTASEGASFDYTVKAAEEFESILIDVVERGDASAALVRVPGFGGRGFNSGVGILVLSPWDERDVSGHDIVRELNTRLGELTGLRAFAGMRSALGGGGGDDIDFAILGHDFATLDAAAEDLVELARDNPNLLRVRKNFEPTSPRLAVRPDVERAADLGVSNDTISRALETQLGSRRVGTYVDRGEEYDVIVQNALADRRDATDLTNAFVRSSSSGQLIPLSSLVELAEIGEADARPRFNRLRAVTVQATLGDGYSLSDAVAWFEQVSPQVLPADGGYEFVGEARDFLKAENAALFAFAMALAIVFLVLAAQFESFIHPFVIMLTVPVAVAGGLFGLLMTDSTINIYSQIGLIILIGLAAKNGILIVEFANQLRAQGASVLEATLEAADTRFRPIVMTGVSTSIGALPLVAASGAGAESRVTIGVVIFSGVLASALFTLVVAPAAYAALARFAVVPGAIERELDAYDENQRSSASAPNL